MAFDQDGLNKVRIDEWDYENIYDEKFRLRLTAKNGLVVGMWKYGEKSGVDLRRWSYDQSRLLGQGISLFSSTWKQLFALICEFYQQGLFTNRTSSLNEAYQKEIVIDAVYTLATDLFEAPGKSFFCVNLYKNGKQVHKSRHTRISIMILFDTISEFIMKSKETNLVHLPNIGSILNEKTIDKKTNREVF